MPQVFQDDSQVAGNIYASCDTPIGLLFSAVIIYELLDIFSFFLVGKPPSMEKKIKMGEAHLEQEKGGKTKQRTDPYLFPCLICTDDDPWPEGCDSLALLCERNNSNRALVLVRSPERTMKRKKKKKGKSNLKIGNDKGTHSIQR